MLQVVFVKWGTRYGTDWVNRHARAVKRHANGDVRFVCITDEHDPTFAEDVEVRLFPKFSVPIESLKRGALLKLSIFAPGMLSPHIPTLYLDLDTSVVGDVTRIEQHISRYSGIHMLRGHWVPWWRVQRFVRQVFRKKYYKANGSAMGFIPAEHAGVFARFNELVEGTLDDENRPKTLRVDDRFLSCHFRDEVRVFPNSLIVKYAQEYMAPFALIETLRNKLPWVQSRRENLVAVSFPGVELKPDDLALLDEGVVIKHKWLRGVWAQQDYRQYWTERAA